MVMYLMIWVGMDAFNLPTVSNSMYIQDRADRLAPGNDYKGGVYLGQDTKLLVLIAQRGENTAPDRARCRGRSFMLSRGYIANRIDNMVSFQQSPSTFLRQHRIVAR